MYKVQFVCRTTLWCKPHNVGYVTCLNIGLGKGGRNMDVSGTRDCSQPEPCYDRDKEYVWPRVEVVARVGCGTF